MLAGGNSAIYLRCFFYTYKNEQQNEEINRQCIGNSNYRNGRL